jgi:hypothetical protein
MAGQGTARVHRDVVLTVLRAHGVESYPSEACDGQTVFTKNGVYEAYSFPEQVSRRMLERMKRKFDIPIHHFFNPQMAPGGIPLPPNVSLMRPKANRKTS